MSNEYFEFQLKFLQCRLELKLEPIIMLGVQTLLFALEIHHSIEISMQALLSFFVNVENNIYYSDCYLYLISQGILLAR